MGGERLVQKYPCKIKTCNKAYIHRKDVIRHMRIRHGITPKTLEPVVVETPEKPHICGVGFCHRSYFHLKDLKRHQRLCHKVSLESASSTSSSVPVADNGHSVTGSTNKSQMRYPCDFTGCLRSYVHKKDLVRHKRLYHKDASSKPSIPVPIWYTDTELKKIRQKVKQEIDTKIQKFRLDSTGSNISNSNDEDGSESHRSIDRADITKESNTTVLLSSSTSMHDSRIDVELDIDPAISSDVASILGALEQHSQQIFRSKF